MAAAHVIHLFLTVIPYIYGRTLTTTLCLSIYIFNREVTAIATVTAAPACPTPASPPRGDLASPERAAPAANLEREAAARDPSPVEVEAAVTVPVCRMMKALENRVRVAVVQSQERDRRHPPREVRVDHLLRVRREVTVPQ